MAGLVPATPLNVARPCHVYRGRRDKPGDDGVRLCHRQSVAQVTRKLGMHIRYPTQACASTTATAVMLTMPRAVTDGVRICTGLAVPIRIGPTASASAMVLIAS
jgi:hypothetical protein